MQSKYHCMITYLDLTHLIRLSMLSLLASAQTIRSLYNKMEHGIDRLVHHGQQIHDVAVIWLMIAIGTDRVSWCFRKLARSLAENDINKHSLKCAIFTKLYKLGRLNRDSHQISNTITKSHKIMYKS